MPLPRPKKSESKDDFIERCMGNETMNKEYPDSDQRYAVCLTQWDKKEGKQTENIIEKRTFLLTNLEIRKKGDDGPTMIYGHAAVFDVIGDGGWFREKIEKGAFATSILSDDIRGLYNHDPNYVLGRNKSGTLQLSEDDRGLYFEVTPPNTQWARDLMVSVERRDITQGSFGFRTIRDEWEYGDGQEQDLRTLKEVKLFDVSLVTYPFYEQTDVAVRSHAEWTERNKKTETYWRRESARKKLALTEFMLRSAQRNRR